MLPESICIEIDRYQSYGWRWQFIGDLLRLRHGLDCGTKHLRWLYEISNKTKKPPSVPKHQERFI